MFIIIKQVWREIVILLLIYSELITSQHVNTAPITTSLKTANSKEIIQVVDSIDLNNLHHQTVLALKEGFVENYVNFVPVLHKYPQICQILFTNEIDQRKHCPRPIGLDIPTDNNRKIRLDRGFIARDRLEIVDLTNLNSIQTLCPDVTNMFEYCSGQLSNIKILMSTDRSDMKPWPMRRSVVIGGQNGIGGVYPELSRPFSPHLIAIKNSFVSSWGYIFDFDKWYIHGGCSDRAWHHPTFDYDLTTHTVVSFNEPVLSLIHPFPSMFYHEFIELHAMFLMSLPLLKANPNITILVNKPLAHTKLFPLLEALDVDMSNYNIIAVKEPSANKKRKIPDNNKLKGSIVFAPFIVTPISLWCQYISRGVTRQMQRQYSKRLPYWNSVSEDNTIVVYDRFNLRPKRFLAEGYQIYEELLRRYGGSRSVKMYYGNETLENTIKLFRSSNVFIAAHGGGQANMIFMKEGGLTVEIRPENWPVPCYIDIADNLNIQHYLYVVKDVGRVGEMHVDLPLFLPVLYSLIDNLNPPNTPAGSG